MYDTNLVRHSRNSLAVVSDAAAGISAAYSIMTDGKYCLNMKFTDHSRYLQRTRKSARSLDHTYSLKAPGGGEVTLAFFVSKAP